MLSQTTVVTSKDLRAGIEENCMECRHHEATNRDNDIVRSQIRCLTDERRIKEVQDRVRSLEERPLQPKVDLSIAVGGAQLSRDASKESDFEHAPWLKIEESKQWKLMLGSKMQKMDMEKRYCSNWRQLHRIKMQWSSAAAQGQVRICRLRTRRSMMMGMRYRELETASREVNLAFEIGHSDQSLPSSFTWRGAAAVEELRTVRKSTAARYRRTALATTLL
jgi:hypothetical protein